MKLGSERRAEDGLTAMPFSAVDGGTATSSAVVFWLGERGWDLHFQYSTVRKKKPPEAVRKQAETTASE